MGKRNTALALGLIVIVGCAAAAAAAVSSHARSTLDGILYWPSYHRGQEAVRATLADPDSAQFKDLYFHSSDGLQMLCGQVNARNRLGGYVGFAPFYAWANRTHPELSVVHVGTNPNFMDIVANCGTPSST